MNDKSKTTLIALSCEMSPHKKTWSDTISCSTHLCGFSYYTHSCTNFWTHCYSNLISLEGMYMHYAASSTIDNANFVNQVNKFV